MTGLAQMAGELAELARNSARAKARRAVTRLAGLAVAGLFLAVATAFGFFGAFVLLAAETGPVTAAFLLAILALLLMVIVLVVTLWYDGRSAKGGELPPEIARKMDALGQEATREIEQAAPYIVAAGFAAGFLSGRK